MIDQLERTKPDVDLEEGTIRFLEEKGGKYSEKPMPYDLISILQAARHSGEVGCGPNDYVIPNRRKATVRRAERCNKVIWNTVVIVAREGRGCRDRPRLPAGVRSRLPRKPPGSARIAPGADESLPDRPTQVYLKALNRSKAMEAVRDLRWGSGFVENALKAHTGFEHPCKSAVYLARGITGVCTPRAQMTREDPKTARNTLAVASSEYAEVDREELR